jgi:hypothetical protein
VYVYIESEPGVFTVGFYTPATTWTPESDHTTQQEAIDRMRYLNGAPESKPPTRAKAAAAPAAAPKK